MEKTKQSQRKLMHIALQEVLLRKVPTTAKTIVQNLKKHKNVTKSGGKNTSTYSLRIGENASQWILTAFVTKKKRTEKIFFVIYNGGRDLYIKFNSNFNHVGVMQHPAEIIRREGAKKRGRWHKKEVEKTKTKISLTEIAIMRIAFLKIIEQYGLNKSP